MSAKSPNKIRRLPKSRTGSFLGRKTAIRYTIYLTRYTIHMSFLFDKRTKTVIRWVWSVVAIVVSIGMVFFFAPGLPEWLASLF